jgi:hypothetical protein
MIARRPDQCDAGRREEAVERMRHFEAVLLFFHRPA